jgi:hypothetical protein
MTEKSWIVKAFHTGGPYEKDAKKLRASAEKFGIPLDIEIIKSCGSWNANTHYKPQSILNAMEKHPTKNIWHLDIDAWFMQYPELFDSALDCHIAAFYHGNKKTWCSGTVYCSNIDAVRKFLIDWQKELLKNPKQHGDQCAMGRILDSVKPPLRVGEIPAAYVQGLSIYVKKGEGVIAHDGARKRYVGTKIYTDPK